MHKHFWQILRMKFPNKFFKTYLNVVQPPPNQKVCQITKLFANFSVKGGGEWCGDKQIQTTELTKWPCISLYIFERTLFIWCVVKPITIFWTSVAWTFWHPMPFAESVLWHCSNDLFLHHFMITYRDVAHTSFGKKTNTQYIMIINTVILLICRILQMAFSWRGILISLEFKTLSLRTQNSLVKENEDSLSHPGSTNSLSEWNAI